MVERCKVFYTVNRGWSSTQERLRTLRGSLRWFPRLDHVTPCPGRPVYLSDPLRLPSPRECRPETTERREDTTTLPSSPTAPRPSRRSTGSSLDVFHRTRSTRETERKGTSSKVGTWSPPSIPVGVLRKKCVGPGGTRGKRKSKEPEISPTTSPPQCPSRRLRSSSATRRSG